MKLKGIKLFIIIFIIVAICLSVVGFTYAVFRVQITGNANASSVLMNLGSLKLNFVDGDYINLETQLSGWTATKTITVENTGTASVNYSLIWEDLTNTFVNKNLLTYSITSTGTGAPTLASTQIPNTGTNLEILDGVSIAAGVTHTYTITFNYELISGDQSSDMRKEFSGKLKIVECNQLFVNGNGELGNNTNFTSFSYSSDVPAGSGAVGSFMRASGSGTNIFSSAFIPIDATHVYEYSAYLKQSVTSTTSFAVGLAEYDIDTNPITAPNVKFVPNTLTTLAQELKNGDSVVYLTNISNFLNASTTPTYNLGFIFWNYTDSTGYTYAAETYSQNVYLDKYYYYNINKTNNTITLKTGWTYGNIPAGTQVSQSSSGGTYNYCLSTGTLPTQWQKYKVTITGTNTNTDSSSKFRPGTKYIKFFMYRSSTLTDFYLANIHFIDKTI